MWKFSNKHGQTWPVRNSRIYKVTRVHTRFEIPLHYGSVQHSLCSYNVFGCVLFCLLLTWVSEFCLLVLGR
jgi:hypothetical protein